MPSSVQNMHKKKLTSENIANLIDDEVEAIEQYDNALDNTDDADEKETIEHIRDEEEEHIEELDGLGKMVDDMDSEQAWEDFKSGYHDFVEQHIEPGQMKKAKDGMTSSIEGKIDTLLAIQQEQMVDIERLTDVIPQLKGEIEENKKSEEMDEEDDDPMADLFGEGYADDGIGVDDEMVIDDMGDEEVDDEFADIPDDEDDYTDDEIAMMDEDGEEATEDVEDDTEDFEVEEESVEEEDGDSEDDYIPIEDIMSDDEDEDVEDDEDEDVDDVLEKMVHAMTKMNKAIKKLTAQVEHLERENRAMKKSINVQPMTATHGQRPIPIKKQVGVVSKPPVGVGYTANQIGGVDEMRSFTKSSPQEILDMCNRVARF